MTMESLHPIRAVAGRTGLSSHVIRAWEKRYGAVEPVRTATNRRLYTERDIERLKLLKRAIDGGRGIGHVADLPDDELQRLVAADGTLPAASQAAGPGADDTPGRLVASCLEAIDLLDPKSLEECLLRASIGMPTLRFLEDVVMPLMDQVGERWHNGRLRPAHEHLATATVRSVLGSLISPGPVEPGAPELVVATPAGQWHELGALAGAVAAAAAGWRVTYLGTNLPAEDIAAAVRERKARAVAISLVYPENDAHLHAEIARLHRVLPEGTTLVAGGRAAPSYAPALTRMGAVQVTSLADLTHALAAARTAGGGRRSTG